MRTIAVNERLHFDDGALTNGGVLAIQKSISLSKQRIKKRPPVGWPFFYAFRTINA
jgi:hypothetical protein